MSGWQGSDCGSGEVGAGQSRSGQDMDAPTESPGWTRGKPAWETGVPGGPRGSQGSPRRSRAGPLSEVSEERGSTGATSVPQGGGTPANACPGGHGSRSFPNSSKQGAGGLRGQAPRKPARYLSTHEQLPAYLLTLQRLCRDPLFPVSCRVFCKVCHPLLRQRGEADGRGE